MLKIRCSKTIVRLPSVDAGGGCSDHLMIRYPTTMEIEVAFCRTNSLHRGRSEGIVLWYPDRSDLTFLKLFLDQANENENASGTHDANGGGSISIEAMEGKFGTLEYQLRASVGDCHSMAWVNLEVIGQLIQQIEDFFRRFRRD